MVLVVMITPITKYSISARDESLVRIDQAINMAPV